MEAKIKIKYWDATGKKKLYTNFQCKLVGSWYFFYKKKHRRNMHGKLLIFSRGVISCFKVALFEVKRNRSFRKAIVSVSVKWYSLKGTEKTKLHRWRICDRERTNFRYLDVYVNKFLQFVLAIFILCSPSCSRHDREYIVIFVMLSNHRFFLKLGFYLK